MKNDRWFVLTEFLISDWIRGSSLFRVGVGLVEFAILFWLVRSYGSYNFLTQPFIYKKICQPGGSHLHSVLYSTVASCSKYIAAAAMQPHCAT